MSSKVFGWDLPPGCTHADIERHFGGPDDGEDSDWDSLKAEREFERADYLMDLEKDRKAEEGQRP